MCHPTSEFDNSILFTIRKYRQDTDRDEDLKKEEEEKKEEDYRKLGVVRGFKARIHVSDSLLTPFMIIRGLLK